MKDFCDRLGGAFVIALSVGLIVGTMVLIHAGKCAADVGFGFITASLLPMAVGHQHHRRCRNLEDRIAAAKSEVRLSVATHANEVRQHVSRLIAGTDEYSGSIKADLAEIMRLSANISAPAVRKTPPRKSPDRT